MIQGARRTTARLRDIIVRVHFAGMRTFGGEKRSMYVFSYTPMVLRSFLPLHDHRDNFNGGFAFAVYHPGTALPQRPWAILSALAYRVLHSLNLPLIIGTKNWLSGGTFGSYTFDMGRHCWMSLLPL